MVGILAESRYGVALNPSKPWDIGGNRYPLNIRASYRVGDDPEPHAFIARAAVEAQISGAIYEMGAAALILPLLCFGIAAGRWRRTR